MYRTRSRLTVAVAAVLALSIGGPGTGAAAEPTGEVASALLVASDLPDDLTGLGVQDATDFDIDQASFDANGGLDKADQTWTAGTVTGVEPVAVVFDFRMLFPDPDAAQAYLDAAESILGETVSGISSVADPPAIGDITRLYAGSPESGGVKVDAQDFLFRIGPVVSKVYVGGFGTTTEDALPIVQAAAARVTGWLETASAASPETSLGPSGGIGQASPAPPGSTLRQWAASAVASTEYGTDSWSAGQATGAPDVASYGDDLRAWAPQDADGSTDWLELTYPQAVVPTGIGIVETFGNGAVTKVEVYDQASNDWVGVWSGGDPTPGAIATFQPALGAIPFATDRLRITLGDVVPGWSEIDAVELVGTVP